MNQSWGQKLFVIKADQASVTGTAEAILCQDIPIVNDLMEFGHLLILKLRGKITTDASAGNITVRVRWNGVAGVLIAASANVALANSQTNAIWEIDGELRVTAEGATGTILGFFTFCSNGLTTIVPCYMSVGGATAPAPSAALDLTGSKNLSVTAQMDNTGNTLVCMEGFLISIN